MPYDECCGLGNTSIRAQRKKILNMYSLSEKLDLVQTHKELLGNKTRHKASVRSA
jgi:hypothetical protein